MSPEKKKTPTKEELDAAEKKQPSKYAPLRHGFGYRVEKAANGAFVVLVARRAGGPENACEDSFPTEEEAHAHAKTLFESRERPTAREQQLSRQRLGKK